MIRSAIVLHQSVPLDIVEVAVRARLHESNCLLAGLYVSRNIVLFGATTGAACPPPVARAPAVEYPVFYAQRPAREIVSLVNNFTVGHFEVCVSREPNDKCTVQKSREIRFSNLKLRGRPLDKEIAVWQIENDTRAIRPLKDAARTESCDEL